MTEPQGQDGPAATPHGHTAARRGDVGAEISSGALPIDPDVDPDEDARHRREPGPFDQPRLRAWPRLPLAILAAVFVGGSVGGLARYEVTKAWTTPAHGFPWATFAINTSGAFALALLLVLVLEVLPASTYLRPLLGTGFCGAWTTFSSIVTSADQLIAHQHLRLGTVYVLSSALAGLAAGSFGIVLGRSIGASRHRNHDTGDAT